MCVCVCVCVCVCLCVCVCVQLLVLASFCVNAANIVISGCNVSGVEVPSAVFTALVDAVSKVHVHRAFHWLLS